MPIVCLLIVTNTCTKLRADTRNMRDRYVMQRLVHEERAHVSIKRHMSNILSANPTSPLDLHPHNCANLFVVLAREYRRWSRKDAVLTAAAVRTYLHYEVNAPLQKHVTIGSSTMWAGLCAHWYLLPAWSRHYSASGS